MAEQAIARGAAPGSSSVSWHTTTARQPSAVSSAVAAPAPGTPKPDAVPKAPTTSDDVMDDIDSSAPPVPITSGPEKGTAAGAEPAPPIPADGAAKGVYEDDDAWGAGGGFDD